MALNVYCQILEKDGQAYMAHICIARILMGQGQLQMALQHIDATRALRPDNDPEVCDQYAEFYLLMGECDAAQQVLGPAFEKYPDCLDLALAAAHLAETPVDVQAALSRLKALEKDLSSPPR